MQLLQLLLIINFVCTNFLQLSVILSFCTLVFSTCQIMWWKITIHLFFNDWTCIHCIAYDISLTTLLPNSVKLFANTYRHLLSNQLTNFCVAQLIITSPLFWRKSNLTLICFFDANFCKKINVISVRMTYDLQPCTVSVFNLNNKNNKKWQKIILKFSELNFRSSLC